VKSSVEALEGNKVRLSIEVDEAEFDRNIDAAFRKIAREVRLPGFRPGKAPRKVLEARIGIEAARSQAIEDAIPEYLTRAVREHDVDIIATPEVELTSGQSDGPVRFDATVEVRPVITVPGYTGLTVEVPSPSLSDEEMAEAVAAALHQHGRLVTADRESRAGDHVVIDMTATRGGEPVTGLNVDEWSYEVGKGWVAPGFDDQMTGVKKGDTVEFTAVPNGTEEPADFTVSVVKVQELELPDVTDEWVKETVDGADTVAAWHALLRDRHEESRLAQVRRILVDRVTDALAGLVDIEAPQAMVDSDSQARLRNMIEQFQAQGISIDQWLSITGQDPEQFIASIKEQSVKAVLVDLALRAVAAAENIEVGSEDVEAEFVSIAERVGEKVEKVRRAYERNDAVDDLVSQLRRSRALDWLMHNCSYVDASGGALDAEVLLGHDHDRSEPTEKETSGAEASGDENTGDDR
jgi:trigger factor